MSSFNDFAANADYLRTEAEVLAETVVDKATESIADQCFRVVTTSKDQINLPWGLSLAEATEFDHTKGFAGQRSYKHEVTLTPKYIAEYYSKHDVNTVPELCAQTQAGFIKSAPFRMYDPMGFTYLLTNPTGYDSVALLSASHRDSHDNLGTSGVGANKRTLVEEALDYQETVTLPTGENIDIQFTELWCSGTTKNEWIEEFGEKRRTNVDSSGDYDQGASVVGMGEVTNTAAGIAVRKIPQFTGEQYLFVDTRMDWMRPIILAKHTSGLEFVIEDAPDSYSVYHENRITQSFHSTHGYGVGLWEFCYGNFTAS